MITAMLHHKIRLAMPATRHTTTEVASSPLDALVSLELMIARTTPSIGLMAGTCGGCNAMIGYESGMASLDLRIDLPDPMRPNYPVVAVLVDGDELTTRVGGERNFIGFDPAELLGAGAPLLPCIPPRRVALYRCECGEAGCASVAPLITEQDGQVMWSDFRDFSGVYVEPTEDENPTGGKQLSNETFAFDAHQYRAEVERASADRSWETVDRATARLLRAALLDEWDVLSERGYRLGWVAPHWAQPGNYQVSFTTLEGHVIVLLEGGAGEPEEQAHRLAAALIEEAPDSWNVTSRNPWPEDMTQQSWDYAGEHRYR